MEHTFSNFSWGVYLDDGKSQHQVTNAGRVEQMLNPNPQSFLNLEQLSSGQNPQTNSGILWSLLQQNESSARLYLSHLRPFAKSNNGTLGVYGVYLCFTDYGMHDDIHGLSLQLLDLLSSAVEASGILQSRALEDKLDELISSLNSPEILAVAQQLAGQQKTDSELGSKHLVEFDRFPTLIIEDLNYSDIDNKDNSASNSETATTADNPTEFKTAEFSTQLKILVSNLFSFELYQQFPQLVVPFSSEIAAKMVNLVKEQLAVTAISVLEASSSESEAESKAESKTTSNTKSKTEPEQIHSSLEYANEEVLNYFRTRKYQAIRAKFIAALNKFKEVNQQLVEKDQQIRSLNESITTLQNQTLGLSSELTSVNDKLKTQQEQLEALNKTQEESQANPEKVQEQAKKLASELATKLTAEATKEYKLAISQAEEKISQLQAQLQTSEKTRTQLTQQLQDFQSEKSRLDKQLEDLRAELATLTTQLEDYKQSSTSEEKKQQQISDAKSDYDSNSNFDSTSKSKSNADNLSDAELLAEANRALAHWQKEYKILAKNQMLMAQERDKLLRLLTTPPLLLVRQDRIFNTGANIFTLSNPNRQNPMFEFVVYECLLQNGEWTYQPPMGTVSNSGTKLKADDQYKMTRADIYELKNSLRLDEMIYEFTWLNEASTKPKTFMTELMKKFNERYPAINANSGSKSTPPARIYVILAISDIDGDDPLYPRHIKHHINPDRVRGFMVGAGIMIVLWLFSWLVGVISGKNNQPQPITQLVPVYQVQPGQVLQSGQSVPVVVPATPSQPNSKPTSQPNIKPTPQPNTPPSNSPDRPELKPLGSTSER